MSRRRIPQYSFSHMLERHFSKKTKARLEVYLIRRSAGSPTEKSPEQIRRMAF